MQLKYLHLSLLISLILAGCNDSRVQDPFERALSLGLPSSSTATILTPKANIRFDQKQTITQKMLIKGASMYLSGRPFGYSHWDVGSNPLVPRLQFAYSDNIRSFTPLADWLPDYYASGAMASMGRYVLSSGAAGSSLIDNGTPGQSVEIRRYPNRQASDLQVPQDPDYVYQAIINHPTEPYFFGFREQDFVTSLKIDNTGLSLTKKTNYASNGQKGTCCVMGGATFKGAAYIGFRSSVRRYNFGPNGTIEEGGVFNNVNGTNIVATNDYLYVQHQAVPGNTASSGIYVINGDGNPMAFLPILPIAFAVTSDNQYLYATMDNDSIRVYQLNWGASGGGGF